MEVNNQHGSKSLPYPVGEQKYGAGYNPYPAQGEAPYGQPAQYPPTYGQPAQAPSPYGQPAQAPSPYGQPVQAPSPYGQPAQYPPPYGQPAQDPYPGTPPTPNTAVIMMSNSNPAVEEQHQVENDLMAFSEKSVRLGFIKKVYGILTIQLLITFGVAAIFYFPESVKNYIYEDPTIVWVAMGMSFVLIIVLACCPTVRRKSPLNFIFLFLFTACEGVLIGTVCAYYDSSAVLMAVVSTIIIVVGLTLFAFQTKIDFTMMSGVLLCLLLALIVFGLLAAIFPSDIMTNLYCALGALIFSAYIVVDTQLIMGGKHKCTISPEEYIFASLNLYLDIVNLFLFLLRLFGN